MLAAFLGGEKRAWSLSAFERLFPIVSSYVETDIPVAVVGPASMAGFGICLSLIQPDGAAKAMQCCTVWQLFGPATVRAPCKRALSGTSLAQLTSERERKRVKSAFYEALPRNHDLKRASSMEAASRPKPFPRRAAGQMILSNKRAVSADGGELVIERKNKQLNLATKKLEEKVKSLQEKSQQVRTLPRVAKEKHPPRANSAPPRELPGVPSKLSLEKRRGSTVTSRIREREAEFQRQVQEREGQIAQLKDRLKILSQKITESKDKDFKFPRDREKVVRDQREDGAELQNIIKQVTKERLQLERHLQIANDSLQRNNGVDLQKYLTLEQSNQYLRQQLDSLDLLQQEHKLVEIQYREKEEACRELMNTLKYKSALCEDLETQLAKVIEKNTQLTMANNDLQKKVVELQDVNEECENLKTTLEKVESEYIHAKCEMTNLNGKVRNLESVLAEMHKAAENRREIERQHKEALENLKKKQEEVEITATKKQAEKIDQLKQRIAELEAEKDAQNERHQELILEMAELKKYGPDSIATSDIEAPSDNLEIDQIMAKLEQDNKFLADLEKQRSSKIAAKANLHSCSDSSGSTSGSANQSPTSLPRTSSAITDSGFLSQSSLSSPGSRLMTVSSSNGSLHKLPGVTGADKINLLNGGTYKSNGSLDKASSSSSSINVNDTTIEKDGSIEVPGKGWCFVYIARYSYDPFQHSPNDSPEAELQVNAGDYILVWGDVDEDGFFDGELLDGRRGLVPSNFVEKLEGEELYDFHQQVVLGLGDCDDSVCTSIPQDLDFMSSDEGLEADTPLKKAKSQQQPQPVHIHKVSLPQYASCTDLDMTEDEDGPEAAAAVIGLKGQVPCPRLLTFEPQQNRSIVIAWSPPETKANHISAYQLIVDSGLYATLKASDFPSNNFKATITNLDLSFIHRISVKAVTKDQKASNEAGCTMVIGKDAPLRPTSVKASHVTSTSATISWIPSNTNFMHAIIVNNCEVKTVKQGVFKHSLAGLSPNTTYKVKVRAKNLKAASYLGDNFHSLSSGVLEVTTKPKGLPDPPLDLQVLRGKNEGSILVTWLPVTINPCGGTSNGAPVLGYIIYGDGEKIKEVNSGTADQAEVEVEASVATITMRTKSVENGLSVESDSCKIPISVKSNLMKDSSNGDLRQPREVVINYSGYPELDSDIGPSELSDIAEEPEEGLTSGSESRGSTPKITTTAAASVASSSTSLSRWTNNTSLSSSQPPAKVTTTKVQINGPTVTSSTVTSTSTSTAAAAVIPKVKIRIFVALFDYDPPTMSPNPDACDEELPFREGQLIKVYGEKDADGFYWGEAGGLKGYVPCNMVSEVQVDDDHVAEELFKEQSTIANKVKVTTSSSNSLVDDRWGDIYEDMPAKRKLALYDYDPVELSPNVDAEVELSFRAGDIILVYGEMDDDGFYMGELNGRRGLVPSNFLTDVPPGYIFMDTPSSSRSISNQPRILGTQRRMW